ncbi:terminase [Agrococcus sp. Marseille-Q4369]|uniref:terminase n=1 Tax=Agrococcus sp. Marseille-Q4369 TaxID=2810513 RepID=UPI001B8C747A|nr:terminase [Agrococcus sp. Marseille-Q4369]QUW18884.1 terminase [Agrococcus sp. Marseille-Q4369]
MAPSAPRGLGTTGRKLWRETVKRYELRTDELEILRAACGEADIIKSIEEALVDADLTTTGSMGQIVAHPLLSEVRQHRVTLASLLGRLKLPDEMGAGETNQQRGAAQSRWAAAFGTQVS